VVGHVLVDALEEAGGNPIDALLANIANDNGTAADALATLASPDGAAVPGWDMGGFGHLPADARMNITSEAALLHPDAVQPAING
jgi:hypothetical protein